VETLRTETAERVRSIVFTRPQEYNTITPSFRDELRTALDDAEADPGVSVVLLAADGPAFCAGYGLDWSTVAQTQEQDWDPTVDEYFIGEYVDVFTRLWYGRKPTVAAVQGWCIGGGTDMVLCADLVIAADDARFGYPPARVWGVPTTGMWVYRLGVERAKRYLLTGDEIPAREAAAMGMILETVPAERLREHAVDLATRIARVPLNQLVLHKRLCNHPVEQMGLATGRLLGTLFDGIACHTPEGHRFVARAMESGFRQAVRGRDDPFGDYGSRPSDQPTTG